MADRPARPAPVSTARQAAAAIAGPALRAVLRGDYDRARVIVEAFDEATIDALSAAAGRLGAVCREIGGR
jgi:hypothetical protein